MVHRVALFLTVCRANALLGATLRQQASQNTHVHITGEPYPPGYQDVVLDSVLLSVPTVPVDQYDSGDESCDVADLDHDMILYASD